MSEQSFVGRTILITGAGRGWGLAYAKAFGRLGATILLHEVGADVDGTGADPSIVQKVAANRFREGVSVHPFHHPINTRDACHGLVRDCLAVNGRLDAVVHNAGWVAYEQIEEVQEVSFDNMMMVMAKAPLWITQAAWPSMREVGYGRIVLTTSCRALYPQYAQKGLASYAAAKMAAVGIMNILAREGTEHGILVNALSPVAKTRMWGQIGEPDELKPESVTPAVIFLASDACTQSGWILRAANGQFHATRATEAEGVDYPRDLRAIRAATPGAIAEKWDQIAPIVSEPRSCVRRKRLLWIDIMAGQFHSYDPVTGHDDVIDVPAPVGMLAEGAAGEIILGLGCDLARLGEDGRVEISTRCPHADQAFRFNDGKYDSQGRLWTGLMNREGKKSVGLLYRFDPDWTWHLADTGFDLPNGLEWSRDGKTFYFTDSHKGEIYAYDFDPVTGEINNRRVFFSMDPKDGKPDGLIMDRSGYLLSVLFDGSAIARITPDGVLERLITLPVPRPTNCAFGSDGRTLFVTTARIGLTDECFASAPASGALLALNYVNVTGCGADGAPTGHCGPNVPDGSPFRTLTKVTLASSEPT